MKIKDIRRLHEIFAREGLPHSYFPEEQHIVAFLCHAGPIVLGSDKLDVTGIKARYAGNNVRMILEEFVHGRYINLYIEIGANIEISGRVEAL